MFQIFGQESEAYLKPSQKSKMEIFAETVGGVEQKSLFCINLYLRYLIGFWIRLAYVQYWYALEVLC